MQVTTCGITLDDMIKFNLAKEVPVLDKRYDVVLHACGKAHVVPKTEAEKQVFFDVNYTGTIHLCDALESWCAQGAYFYQYCSCIWL